MDSEQSDFDYDSSEDEKSVLSAVSTNILPQIFQKPSNEQSISQQQKKPIQLIYFIYDSYFAQLQQFAYRYQCELKIGLDYYKIIGKDEKSLKQCYKQIHEQINLIRYFKCEYERKLGMKMYNSPYFIKQTKSMGINMTVFNKQLYFHSNKCTQAELKKTYHKLLQSKNIFPIHYRSLHFNNCSDTYKELVKYFEKVFIFNKPKFEENNIHTQINMHKNCINVISELQKNCMFGKNILRNMLESLVCITFKNIIVTHKEQKKLLLYCQSISKNPIHFCKLSENQFLLIGKDSLVKQLVQKQKFKDLLPLREQSEVGMFLLAKFGRQQKRDQMRKISNKKGYDILRSNYYHYFKKTFYSQQIKQFSSQEIFSILAQILEKFIEIKQRFETFSQTNKPRFEPKQDKQFYITGGKDRDQDLSKLLKRDVLKQSVYMNKKFLIKYNSLEIQQTKDIYWVVEDQKVTEISLKDFKKNECFKGSRKINGEQKLYKIESILTLI